MEKRRRAAAFRDCGRHKCAAHPAKRSWVALLNLIAIGFAAVLFLIGAFISSRWIPEALTDTLAGFGAGCMLGLRGRGGSATSNGSRSSRCRHDDVVAMRRFL
jgi:hypothetical protein